MSLEKVVDYIPYLWDISIESLFSLHQMIPNHSSFNNFHFFAIYLRLLISKHLVIDFVSAFKALIILAANLNDIECRAKITMIVLGTISAFNSSTDHIASGTHIRSLTKLLQGFSNVKPFAFLRVKEGIFINFNTVFVEVFYIFLLGFRTFSPHKRTN